MLLDLPYHEAAMQILFKPLELKRMTFENPLPTNYGNIAKAHDKKSNPIALPREYQAMPEAAASGLWTSVNDLADLLIKLYEGEKNKDSESLTPELIQDMITNQEPSPHRLGPRVSLYENCTVVEHRGDNESYRAMFALFWKERKGYIISTNGSDGRKMIDDLFPILDNYLKLERITKG